MAFRSWVFARGRWPDVRDGAKRVLVTLQARIDKSVPDCRFKQALEGVVTLANPSPDEWGRIAFGQPADGWPDYEALAARLVGNYARMLDVPVDRKSTRLNSSH